MRQVLKGKIALITGATKGIGRAVALRYAQEGAHIIALGRSMKDLESLDDEIKKKGKQATLIPFDLKKINDISSLGSNLLNRFGKLDILVGNAGILGQLGPMHQISSKVWWEVMTINLTANWYLLQVCDPLLRLSDAGRIIFVTSGVTRSVHPYWGAYAVSKSALETMVQTYAGEISKTPMLANLINPGSIRTNMRAQAMPGENPLVLPEPAEITQTFVDLALSSCQKNGEIVTI